MKYLILMVSVMGDRTGPDRPEVFFFQTDRRPQDRTETVEIAFGPIRSMKKKNDYFFFFGLIY